MNKKPKTKLLTLLLLMMCLSCSCSSSKITEEELVGIWKPDKSSMNFLENNGYKITENKIELTLNADKTFELRGMPVCWKSIFGGCYLSTNSYEGTWKVFQQNNLFLTSNSTTHNVSITGVWKRNISFYFGDADNGEGINFVKQ